MNKKDMLFDRAYRHQKYYIQGYDKDAGVYETICNAKTMEHAVMTASSLMHCLMYTEEICRSKTGEPFDWFVIIDGSGRELKIFTADNPDGTDA